MGKVILIFMGLAFLYVLFFVGRCYCTARKILKEKPIQVFYEEVKRRPTYFPIEEISTNIKFVVLCLEDANFFKHRGYNIRRILYAVYRNIGKKNLIGGSTISQQLAKNMYFSFKKSYKRKVAELFVARKIEKTLTKEQIFDIYLNIIYYGMEQYNIKDACEFYFSKTPAEVSLNQALTVGSLLPAPTNYNPLSTHGLFEQARNIALRRMVYLKVIDENDISMFQKTTYNEDVTELKALEYEQLYGTLYHQYKNNRKRIGTKI